MGIAALASMRALAAQEAARRPTGTARGTAKQWTPPRAIRMPLKRDNTQSIFEYACHEGNRGLENILSAARAEEAAGESRERGR